MLNRRDVLKGGLAGAGLWAAGGPAWAAALAEGNWPGIEAGKASANPIPEFTSAAPVK